MRTLQVSHNKPPVFDSLQKQFGVKWSGDLLIAYNGCIHTPAKKVLPQKVVHEFVHFDEQDKIGNALWWDLYLSDPDFRLAQEKLAYKAEVEFIKRNIKDKNLAFKLVREIAHGMASSMYGGMITASEAFTFLNS